MIGIVLSGHLDDGTAGLQAIKACGGIAVVQDPREAQVSSMPMSALRHVDVDHCLPSAGMARLLTGLVAEPAPQPQAATPPTLAREHALSVGPQGEEVVKNLQALPIPPLTPVRIAAACSGKSRTRNRPVSDATPDMPIRCARLPNR